MVQSIFSFKKIGNTASYVSLQVSLCVSCVWLCACLSVRVFSNSIRPSVVFAKAKVRVRDLHFEKCQTPPSVRPHCPKNTQVYVLCSPFCASLRGLFCVFSVVSCLFSDFLLCIHHHGTVYCVCVHRMNVCLCAVCCICDVCALCVRGGGARAARLRLRFASSRGPWPRSCLQMFALLSALCLCSSSFVIESFVTLCVMVERVLDQFLNPFSTNLGCQL